MGRLRIVDELYSLVLEKCYTVHGILCSYHRVMDFSLSHIDFPILYCRNDPISFAVIYIYIYV